MTDIPRIGESTPEYVSETAMQYHADKSRMSSSMIKTLTTRSPGHLIESLKQEDEDSDAMRFGRVLHLAVLEPKVFEATVRCMPDFGTMKSVSNREKKSAWLADLPPGAEAVTDEEMSRIKECQHQIRLHRLAATILEEGKCEVTGHFTHPETGVMCKIRPDFMRQRKDGSIQLVDLKSATDGSLEGFSTAMARYQYHIQAAMYPMGVEIISKKRVSFAFIVVESKPPHACAIYVPNQETLDFGRSWVEYGLRKYRECVDLKHFPYYQSDGAQDVGLPKWALRRGGYGDETFE